MISFRMFIISAIAFGVWCCCCMGNYHKFSNLRQDIDDLTGSVGQRSPNARLTKSSTKGPKPCCQESSGVLSEIQGPLQTHMSVSRFHFLEEPTVPCFSTASQRNSRKSNFPLQNVQLIKPKKISNMINSKPAVLDLQSSAKFFHLLLYNLI